MTRDERADSAPPSHREQSHPELPVDPDAGGTGQPRRDGTVVARVVAALLVVAGGILGTLTRYGLEQLAATRTDGWPWGTFAANLLGAFMLGVLLEALAQSGPDRGWRLRARLFGGTGFCGGLTTYSTFAVEADLLVRADRPGLALAYLLITVTAGLVVTGSAIAAASRLTRRRAGRRAA